MTLTEKRIQKAMRASLAAKNPKFKALWRNVRQALIGGDETLKTRNVN